MGQMNTTFYFQDFEVNFQPFGALFLADNSKANGHRAKRVAFGPDVRYVLDTFDFHRCRCVFGDHVVHFVKISS